MKKNNQRVLEEYNGLKLFWLHDSLFFIIAIILIFVLFRFCIGISIVGGDSMSPTLTDGEIVLYSRLVSDYKAGDIVSLRVPSGDFYVKRVAASEGDTIDLRDGKVYVNERMTEDKTSCGSTMKESYAVIYPYRISSGSVFVLGDNRQVSLDSRLFGEVSRRQIKGKIFFRLKLDKNGVKFGRIGNES